MDQQVVPPKRWLVIVNALLAAFGLGLAAWCVSSVLDSPFGGMRAPAYLILFLLLWLGSNRGFALWQQFTASGLARTALRLSKWILPFLLPFVVIHAIEGAVQARQLELAAAALAPVIDYADHLSRGAFNAAEAPAPSFPAPVHMLDADQTYALWLRAPSVDLDGYTLSYDPTSRHWQRRHNDFPDAAPSADGRCILEHAAWRCSEPGPAQPRVVD